MPALFFQIANPDGSVVVHLVDISQLLHHFESTSCLEAFHQHSHGTVTILIIIRQGFDQVVTCSLRWGVCPKDFCFLAVRAILYDQDSVLISPIVLAAARHAPPIALQLLVPLRNPTDVVFNRESVAVSAHWHDDSPQKLVLLGTICCSMVFRFSSSYSISPSQRLSLLRKSAQSLTSPVLAAEPSKLKTSRQNSSSSRYGDSFCQLPIMS